MNITILEELREIKVLLTKKVSDRWLNINEAVNYCGLSNSTIRRAIQSGQLKCSKKTGKLLFKQSALDRWLND